MNLNDRTINALQGRIFPYQQSENAKLLYTIDWSSSYAPDTIVSSEWISSGNISVESEATTDYTASAILSGQPGTYKVVNKIVTSSGETDERIIQLKITINDLDTFNDYVCGVC